MDRKRNHDHRQLKSRTRRDIHNEGNSDEDRKIYYVQEHRSPPKYATREIVQKQNGMSGDMTHYSSARISSSDNARYRDERHHNSGVQYTYHHGNEYIDEDQIANMSNIVVKDRIVEKTVYVEPPKQLRNVGVQMTTKYVAPPPEPPKQVRDIITQTKFPSPPSTPLPEVVMTDPPKLRFMKFKPKTKIIQVRQPKEALYCRVGGGWEKIKDHYKHKHYPVTVVDTDTNTVREKHFMLQSGSRKMRDYYERLAYDKCRGKPQSIPGYIFKKLNYC